MSNTIIVICGKGNSGKSTLIRTFFKREELIPKGEIIKKVMKGRLVFAVGDTSPQEQNDFCKVEDVKSDIRDRLNICEEKAKGKDYVLLLPFTISRKNGKNDRPNTDCIKKPIEWLKTKFSVYIIYLRKMDYADIMMRDFADNEIQSVTDEESEQAKELKRIMSQL
jgi:GTPase SAR1 family protein